MSIIRKYGDVIFNLTKIIKINKNRSLYCGKPCINFVTNLTNNYGGGSIHAYDNSNYEITFDSIKERDDEFDDIE